MNSYFQLELKPSNNVIKNLVTRYCTKPGAPNGATKPKKVVGYWLLGCSGMVFVAVILGVTIAYAVVLSCVCHVISLIIPMTKNK